MASFFMAISFVKVYDTGGVAGSTASSSRNGTATDAHEISATGAGAGARNELLLPNPYLWVGGN